MDQNTDRPTTTYRAFVVNDKGHLGGVPQLIVAHDDGDASRQAEAMAGWNAIEVWDGARLVACVMPHQGLHPQHP